MEFDVHHVELFNSSAFFSASKTEKQKKTLNIKVIVIIVHLHRNGANGTDSLDFFLFVFNSIVCLAVERK